MNPAHNRIAWQPPRPLWRGTTSFSRAPQLLRFASDEFMEQMIATLDEDPAAISRLVAKPETWHTPMAENESSDLIQRVPIPAPVANTKRRLRLGISRPASPPPAPAPESPLKLYQPAHMRHYLVAGSLTCAVPGLPEHILAGSQERVGYVIRRLLPASASPSGDQTKVEFAFIQEGDEQRWQRVADAGSSENVLAPGEEILPLFRLPHRDEVGRARGLWTGVIPVGRRDDYHAKPVDRTVVALAAGQQAALRPGARAAPAPSKSARLTRFKMEVAEPWKAMIRAAAKASDDLRASSSATARQRFDFNLQFQMQSWLILLDLADWLEAYLPRVWTAVKASSPDGLSGNEFTLFQRLEAAHASELVVPMRDPANQLSTTGNLKPMAPSLVSALSQVRAAGVREMLEGKTTHYAAVGALAREADWPPFHFPLAGLDTANMAKGPFAGVIAGLTEPQIEGDAAVVETPAAIPPGGPDPEALDKFTALVGRALPAQSEADVQPVPFALKLRDSLIATAGDDGLFVIRFVHLNRDCGPLHPPTLSEPTEKFRMASFFDPDAPVRPIRITLPLDTSPAGLRKYGRGTAFVLSDMLCGQVQRAKGLGLVDLIRQVLPAPLHKDLDMGNGGGCKGSGEVEIGMICSLSIPIITICALLLLIIIVMLLDFIFRWLPWFILCLPIPGLKGKKGATA
ncbi:MAG TPA: hypothetical protein VMN38_01970 [Sphingomicrobium sp.]|nr:hypothetical protein [Sphingomicrobium sp.]